MSGKAWHASVHSLNRRASPKTHIRHRNMLLPLISNNVESEFSSGISGDHVKGQEGDQKSISEDVEFVGPITRSGLRGRKVVPVWYRLQVLCMSQWCQL